MPANAAESAPFHNYSNCPLPQRLEVFPDAKNQIVTFAGVKNEAMLTIESVHDDLIISTVIPRLTRTWMNEVKSMNMTTTSSTTSSTNKSTTTADEALEETISIPFLRSMDLNQ